MVVNCLLANPALDHCPWFQETLKLMRSGIDQCRDGDMAGLWLEVHSYSKSLSKCNLASAESTQSLRDRNVRRAKQVAYVDQYRKAIKALTSGGIASPFETMLQEMQSKHPQSPLSKLPIGPLPPSISITKSTALKCALSFPRGSNTGSSGLCPSYLHEAAGFS